MSLAVVKQVEEQILELAGVVAPLCPDSQRVIHAICRFTENELRG